MCFRVFDFLFFYADVLIEGEATGKIYCVRDEADSSSTNSCSKTGEMMRMIEELGPDVINFLDVTATYNDFFFKIGYTILVENILFISRKLNYTGWWNFEKHPVEFETLEIKGGRKILSDSKLVSLFLQLKNRGVIVPTAENGLKIPHPVIVSDFRSRYINVSNEYVKEMKLHPILRDYVVISNTSEKLLLYSKVLFERFGSNPFVLGNPSEDIKVLALPTDDEGVYMVEIVGKIEDEAIFKISSVFNFLEGIGASTFPHILVVGTKILNGRCLTVGGDNWCLTDQICGDFKTEPEALQFFRLCNSRGYKFSFKVHGPQATFDQIDTLETR